ncbi:heavy metal translocating P-type ATPase [Agromyces flavus]|uniref:Heavy metal translocating P-type ATPase n=1 Tax=Agromyces flavus TaxID=589382 RepID=A0A1H1LXS1_9MICO|nr:heavy metal translocating P-type ATPase [Agromyces flavus]MCP2368668.1 heavy metal translocating P-type ATPase [Agromyces flavus]GGI48092.1 cobalt ABC transporter ATP-binding protein [Agromyces flavus]SDR79313.1 heavy metal-(Cd/Co/Hg/Pb/Zn)-translocating P-type ATPase [Agromyces flavus]
MARAARPLRLIRRYPIVALTLGIGVLGIVLALTGQGWLVAWIFSIYALGIAAWQAVGMVRDILGGHWGLDILAVTALVATVAVGEYVAALIVVLMLTGGEALEDYADRRAKRELDALLARAPQRAHRVVDDHFEDVPVDEVRPGDVLLVRPSEIVPVDGELRSAETSVDESSITGESVPVEKSAGDELLSGSVNGPVAVEITATARAADSQYQQIVALVAEAAASKAPVVRLADRYAVPFTVFSLLLAGVAWWVSGDPVRFAEVLVLATPCPLLIAAPVAFIGGMSRAARNGIIVKGGGVLEQLARAKTAVFDKTGTLTHGEPELVAVRTEPGFGSDELLVLVASAEQYSSHVLAASIMQAATDRGLRLVEGEWARESATNGVTARIGGRDVTVGKFAYVRERAPEARRTEISPGELAVYVAVDGRFAGALLARDRLRGNARATLERLDRLGVRHTMMLTGDAQATADHIAAELGLERVRAECLPADKVQEVSAIAERPVIMVGDGVNDAPVLAAADIGVAMGARGATAASESADAVILVDDISRTAKAVEIGRDTVRIALQSIWLGIIVSVGLMLVAAFGFIPATAGALLQEFVDLAAILAALRAIGGRRDAAASAPVPEYAATSAR